MIKNKCECDSTGILYEYQADQYDPATELPFVTHNPNECQCTNELKLYRRNNKLITLCSCCCLYSDEEVPHEAIVAIRNLVSITPPCSISSDQDRQ